MISRKTRLNSFSRIAFLAIGVRVTRLSSLLGIDAGSVSRVLAGRQSVSQRHLGILASLLHVPASDLIGPMQLREVLEILMRWTEGAQRLACSDLRKLGLMRRSGSLVNPPMSPFRRLENAQGMRLGRRNEPNHQRKPRNILRWSI